MTVSVLFLCFRWLPRRPWTFVMGPCPLIWSHLILYSPARPQTTCLDTCFFNALPFDCLAFSPPCLPSRPGPSALKRALWESTPPHSQHQQMTSSTLSRKLVLNSSGGWGLLSSGHASAFTCSLNSQARREPVWFVSASENPAQGLVLSGHVGNEWRNGYTHNESMARWVRCCHC